MTGKVLQGVTSRKRRLLSLVLIGSVAVGALVGGGAVAAFAVNSQTGYFTVAGIQYSNYATLGVSTSGGGAASGATWTQFASGCTSTGYAGSRARLFDASTGALVYQDPTIRYNSSCSSALSSVVQTGHRAWYSYGVSWGWNGSGYSAYYTYQTIAQNS